METPQFIRWFRPRFSLRTLFILVTIICVALAWNLFERRERQRLLCSQLVDKVLVSKHWAADQKSGGYAAFVSQFASELGSQSEYISSFLHLNGTLDDGKPIDDFEKQILAKWSSVPSTAVPLTSETAESSSLLHGSFVYYQAIRAKQSICISCHSNMLQNMAAATGQPTLGTPLKVGDLIGIVKIELAK
jgi:hypothetical protein